MQSIFAHLTETFERQLVNHFWFNSVTSEWTLLHVRQENYQYDDSVVLDDHGQNQMANGRQQGSLN